MQTLDFELDRDYVELKQLLKLTDLVSSGGEAKVIIGEGHVRVDGEVFEDAARVFLPGFEGVLAVGKRNFARIRLGVAS